MRLLKISAVFIFFALCLPLFSNELLDVRTGRSVRNASGSFTFNFTRAGGRQSADFSAGEFNLNSITLFAGRTGYGRGSAMSNKRKAAIAVFTIGMTFFVTGLVFLITSLSYSYYINQNGNTKNYDEYIKGQNVSRGLFYASMATMGTGAVFIVVSIPLFVENKRRR